MAPDAHSQAPSPICALLSGIKTTVILYVILRLIPVLNASGKIDIDAWAMVVGLFSVGIAAFLIIQVTDYKRLFASPRSSIWESFGPPLGLVVPPVIMAPYIKY